MVTHAIFTTHIYMERLPLVRTLKSSLSEKDMAIGESLASSSKTDGTLDFMHITQLCMQCFPEKAHLVPLKARKPTDPETGGNSWSIRAVFSPS